MSQNDLFEFFKLQYAENPEKYFTLQELNLFFKENEYCLRRKVLKLYAYGYLERKVEWVKLSYRLKQSQKDSSEVKSPFDNTLTKEEWRKAK